MTKVEIVAEGILAAFRLEVMRGGVDQLYSPSQMTTMLRRVVDDQVARLGPTPDSRGDPSWTEDDEGYVRAPLSYENREGDPAFNGALDKW